MTEEQLAELRRRILLPWQVQRGSSVWAPWGKSGWSAVVVKTSQRKWAVGMRVKPATGDEVAKGKVPKGRLIKRDLSLKGKDRPEATPEEVFAPMEKADADAAALKKQAKAKTKAPPEPKLRSEVDLVEPEKRVIRDAAWFKKSWDKTFGEGAWDADLTNDDDDW